MVDGERHALVSRLWQSSNDARGVASIIPVGIIDKFLHDRTAVIGQYVCGNGTRALRERHLEPAVSGPVERVARQAFVSCMHIVLHD